MTLAKRLYEQQHNRSRRSVTLADTNVEKTRANTMRRALILLRLFESRYWVSYDNIRDAFGGVSYKTAYRWIKALEDAGWPLTSEERPPASGRGNNIIVFHLYHPTLDDSNSRRR